MSERENPQKLDQIPMEQLIKEIDEKEKMIESNFFLFFSVNGKLKFEKDDGIWNEFCISYKDEKKKWNLKAEKELRE